MVGGRLARRRTSSPSVLLVVGSGFVLLSRVSGWAVLGGAHGVFDAGVGAVAGDQQLDRQAGSGVGDEAAVLVAVQLEQGWAVRQGSLSCGAR
jgi:hypothetical protein